MLSERRVCKAGINKLQCEFVVVHNYPIEKILANVLIINSAVLLKVYCLRITRAVFNCFTEKVNGRLKFKSI